jgi:hypothetical protein
MTLSLNSVELLILLMPIYNLLNQITPRKQDFFAKEKKQKRNMLYLLVVVVTRFDRFFSLRFQLRNI